MFSKLMFTLLASCVFLFASAYEGIDESTKITNENHKVLHEINVENIKLQTLNKQKHVKELKLIFKHENVNKMNEIKSN